MAGIFTEQQAEQEYIQQQEQAQGMAVPYNVCPLSKVNHIVVFCLAVAVGLGVFYVFYHSVLISAVGALLIVPFVVNGNAKSAINKRKVRLRNQFKDFLESLNVSMRAGSNEIKAIAASLEDLSMIYSADADIIVEVSNILKRYRNGIPLRDLFYDFGMRSGLDDIISFATIFKVIEGKSDRTTEIIRQTQQIITDKIEIEAEIETMITSTKSEQNIMMVMPVVIVAAMSLMGGDLMGAMYTTMSGRLITTGVIVLFIVAYLISNKITKIDV